MFSFFEYLVDFIMKGFLIYFDKPYQLDQSIWYKRKCKNNEEKPILDHRNSIVPGIIRFSMEQLSTDEITVLDLKTKQDKVLYGPREIV